MDRTIINDIANSVVRYKLYPYFNGCNYILMSMAVREDAPQSGNSVFSRRHPFSCWFATMIMCFASNLMFDVLIGESVLAILKDTDELLLATACWYAINYSPFDIVYRLMRLPPVRFILCILKEIQRTKKIYKGVKFAIKRHPNSILIWLATGTIKGSAYAHVKMVERLVRGVWLPASNEFLKPSFTTKASLSVATLFVMVHLGKVPIDTNLAFLIAMTFLIYFRAIILILGVSDPYSPLENVICGIVFGGVIDAIRNAWKRTSSSSSNLRADGSRAMMQGAGMGNSSGAGGGLNSGSGNSSKLVENGSGGLGNVAGMAGDGGLGNSAGQERKKDV